MAQFKNSKIPSLSNLPTLGPGESIGEGDSYIVHDLITSDVKDPTNPSVPLKDIIFETLREEVAWQKMYHAAGEVPRLVAVQGLVDTKGNKPVYRHPSDQSPPLLPFTPTVLLVKAAAEKAVGHELNHVLIQLYRDGKDHITEHSDKTLDIVKGTMIVNASFGARRTMRLRGKRKAAGENGAELADMAVKSSARRNRDTQRVHMPHNSLFVLGPATNTSWLHGITPDKRQTREKSEEELAYDGARISLTFRLIGTFLNSEETKIWGQGATGKTQEEAKDIIAGNELETERMIKAFGRENREDVEGWNWDEVYGDGFDVLHFTG